MSIEKNLERIADALEALLAEDAKLVEEKPKRKRAAKKKAEAKPDPQPEAAVAEAEPASPAAASIVPDEPEKPAAGNEEAETMTAEQLNEGLMNLAKGAPPTVVKAIFDVLESVGAKNTHQVPENRRTYVLDKAKAAVGGVNAD